MRTTAKVQRTAAAAGEGWRNSRHSYRMKSRQLHPRPEGSPTTDGLTDWATEQRRGRGGEGECGRGGGHAVIIINRCLAPPLLLRLLKPERRRWRWKQRSRGGTTTLSHPSFQAEVLRGIQRQRTRRHRISAIMWRSVPLGGSLDQQHTLLMSCVSSRRHCAAVCAVNYKPCFHFSVTTPPRCSVVVIAFLVSSVQVPDGTVPFVSDAFYCHEAFSLY